MGTPVNRFSTQLDYNSWIAWMAWIEGWELICLRNFSPNGLQLLDCMDFMYWNSSVFGLSPQMDCSSWIAWIAWIEGWELMVIRTPVIRFSPHLDCNSRIAWIAWIAWISWIGTHMFTDYFPK